MGNEKSKKTSVKQNVTGTISDDTKKVVVLHESQGNQLKIIRNFRDALVSTANGGVRVIEIIDITEKKLLKDTSWLEQQNNVILLCLASEINSELEKLIKDDFLDNNDHLHGKVFTVSFGGKLASRWSRACMDVRDFTFDFENIENLKPKDFENSKMTTLVAAIKGTK